jgi:hypothetical protein
MFGHLVLGRFIADFSLVLTVLLHRWRVGGLESMGCFSILSVASQIVIFMALAISFTWRMTGKWEGVGFFMNYAYGWTTLDCLIYDISQTIVFVKCLLVQRREKMTGHPENEPLLNEL